MSGTKTFPVGGTEYGSHVLYPVGWAGLAALLSGHQRRQVGTWRTTSRGIMWEPRLRSEIS